MTFADGGVRIEVDHPGTKAGRPQLPLVLDTRDWLAPADAAPAVKPAALPPSASVATPPPTGVATGKPPKSGAASKHR